MNFLKQKYSYESDSKNNSTPFNPVFQHFAWLCGQVNEENKRLRIMAFGSLVGFLVALCCVVVAIRMPRTIPVLVTMDDFGDTHYVGQIRDVWDKSTVPEKAIQRQLQIFLTGLFSLSTDKEVIRERLKDCYASVSSEASIKMTKLLKAENPITTDYGKKTKTVVFESIVHLSQKTYQVDYWVTESSASGHETHKRRWRAILQTDLLVPSEDDFDRNPLGIYITDFDFVELKGEEKR